MFDSVLKLSLGLTTVRCSSHQTCCNLALPDIETLNFCKNLGMVESSFFKSVKMRRLNSSRGEILRKEDIFKCSGSFHSLKVWLFGILLS